MPFSSEPNIPDEIVGRFTQELQSRGINLGPCSVCQTTAGFTLAGLVRLYVAEFSPATHVPIGGPYLPSAALICNRCGNTLFLNLNVIGLHDLSLSVQEREQEQKQQSSTPAAPAAAEQGAS